MKLKPLHDWAVLVPGEAENRTAGGLFIPDTAKEKPKEGVVEAIGPGAYEEEKRGKKKEDGKERKFIPTVVKPGDRVLYESWPGQTVKLGAEERVLVRERGILGIIERPLQIPDQTSHQSETALARYASAPPAKKNQGSFLSSPVEAKTRKAKPAKKSAKKKAVKKKFAQKAVKKAVKPSKKSSSKSAKAGKGRASKATKSGKKK